MEGMFQMKNPHVRLLPFFILTENNDLAAEYEYRNEGVNDYITAPVIIKYPFWQMASFFVTFLPRHVTIVVKILTCQFCEEVQRNAG